MAVLGDRMGGGRKSVTAAAGLAGLGIDEAKAPAHQILGVVNGEAVDKWPNRFGDDDVKIAHLKGYVLRIDALGWAEVVNPLGTVARLEMNSQAMVIGGRLQKALDLLGGCGAQMNHGDVWTRG